MTKMCIHGHEKTPDNLNKYNECRICANARSKRQYEKNKERASKYYETNKEKILARVKQRREDKKELLSEIDRKYYQANKEKIKARTKQRYEADKLGAARYKRQYRENNREFIAEGQRRYHKNNPMVRRTNWHRYRDRVRESGGNLSKDIVNKLLDLQKGKCRICKTKINTGNMHLDHITPISKGGPNIDSNVQLLCPTCNLKKGAKLPEIHAQELGMLFY